jgi:5'-3' exonuclease
MTTIIIDTSYFNFYRFFATTNWYKCAHQDEVIEDGYEWVENVEFWEKFKKMFLQTLQKFEKKFKPDRVIFARDCPRDKIWRVPHYPDYKSNREVNYTKNKFTGGPVFKKCYTDIIGPLIDNSKYYQFKVDELEADDIIALTTTKILDKNPDEIIKIISSDHDLLQLITPQVELYDAKMKCYNCKSLGCKKKDIAMKCIVGDASDCIPKIFNRVGNKTALKLIEDTDSLLKKFNENPGSFDLYSKNNLLINFDNIPEYLVKRYNDEVSF